MADTKSSRESSTEKQGQQMERRQGEGLARRESWPSLFSLSPREFFSTGPFELMRRFTNEMDRAFAGWGGRGEGHVWAPAVEVQQKGDNLIVRADLPGMNKDDVKLEVTDEGLVIQGERKQEHEERHEGMYRSERSYGRFYRLIPLPDDAKFDQAKAQFNNGVLEVTIPAPQKQQRRREIAIEGGEKPRAAGGGGA